MVAHSMLNEEGNSKRKNTQKTPTHPQKHKTNYKYIPTNKIILLLKKKIKRHTQEKQQQ